MTKLQEQWNEVCNAYLKAFAEKHGFHRYDWVGDDVGGIACLDDDTFVGINEMRYDIDNGIPKMVFFEWFEYDERIRELQAEYDAVTNRKELATINYPSFCKGAPLPYCEVELRTMESTNKRLEELQSKFISDIENLASKGEKK